MSRFQEFVSTVTTALNPKKYDILDIRPLSAAIGYFFAMVFVVFVLMSVLWLPNLLTINDYVSEQLNKFDSLSVEVIYDQTEPIVIPEDNPLITIDTLNDYDDIEQGIFLVSANKTFIRPLPFMESQIIEDTDNLAENYDQTLPLLSIIILMMIPMALAFLYVYFALKYLLIILIATVIGYVFAGVIHFQINFEQLFKAGLYAATIMAVIGLLTKPFVPNVSYLDYVAFAIIYILAIIRVGEFEETISEKKNKREFSD